MHLFRVHDFICEAFRDGFRGLERGFSGAYCDEVDGLADSSEWGNIHSLFSDDTTGSDSGGILSGSGVLHCLDKDLDGVAAGHEGDDFEGVLDDTAGEHFLTGVAAVVHHGPDETLDDGTLGLAEFLDLVTAGSVGHTDLGLGLGDGDVVGKAGIRNFDFGVVPLVKELWLVLEGQLVFVLDLDDGGWGWKRG